MFEEQTHCESTVGQGDQGLEGVTPCSSRSLLTIHFLRVVTKVRDFPAKFLLNLSNILVFFGAMYDNGKDIFCQHRILKKISCEI